MQHIQDAALSLYENGALDEDQIDSAEYREAEIYNRAEQSLPISLKAEWDTLNTMSKSIGLFIRRCDEGDWDMKFYPHVSFIPQGLLDDLDTPEQEQSCEGVCQLKEHSDQYRGIVLSVTHLRETTIHWLNEQSNESSDVIDRTYGFIVILHKRIFSGNLVPNDLTYILRQCHLAGFKQVIFADDGQISKALPEYSQVN